MTPDFHIGKVTRAVMMEFEPVITDFSFCLTFDSSERKVMKAAMVEFELVIIDCSFCLTFNSWESLFGLAILPNANSDRRIENRDDGRIGNKSFKTSYST
eukprot:3399745-Ditylum_brightwellii.AAC.1